ncbi:hypothetical protein CGLO_04325 [Colletotrichum gloeosporioides Cg-14]|uniref:Uncharacterized protein n=1 Tax=Colletotrichum gloeosporioides (strain Cg-14) TaxID=1237896 RepID=T0M4I3_COLGC|nr:hypothetical protein CGLO_04325 [Colletotrichum gloeosporioides Cg-14]
MRSSLLLSVALQFGLISPAVAQALTPAPVSPYQYLGCYSSNTLFNLVYQPVGGGNPGTCQSRCQAQNRNFAALIGNSKLAVRQYQPRILHGIWKPATGCIVPVIHQYHLIPSHLIVIFFVVIFIIIIFIYVVGFFIGFVAVLVNLFFNFVDVVLDIFVSSFILIFTLRFIFVFIDIFVLVVLFVNTFVFAIIFCQFYWVTHNVWEPCSIIFGIILQQFHWLGGGLFSRK